MRRPSINLIAAGLLLLAAVNAVLFWVRSLGQPLIDAQSFRQTQTALSALWLQPGLNGLLHYETPVLGSPWSIPFEFPFYQWIVAALAATTRLDLSLTGRLVSLLFGLGVLAVATALLRESGFSRLTRLLFATLYLSSSIYLYWNRAFLIESTALFFTLTALLLYGRALRASDDRPLPRRLLQPVAFCLSLTLALLVKATTATPLLLLLGCHLLWRLLRRRGWGSRAALTTSLALLAGLAIAFLVLRGWTQHADALKSLNPYGLKLTSKALSGWNFGSPEQRLSGDLWSGVVIQRMMNRRTWLPLSLLLLAGVWQLRQDRGRMRFVILCIALWLVPLLLFPNLHIIHDYYQASNQIYLLLAIAASAATILEQPLDPAWIRILVGGLLLVYIIADAKRFDHIYRSQAYQSSDEKLEVSRIVDARLDRDAAILVLGDDWYSSFPYLSRRRALALPRWYETGAYSEAGVLGDPRPRLSPHSLGAIISERPLSAATLAPICPGHEHAATAADGRWNLYLCAAGQRRGAPDSDSARRS